MKKKLLISFSGGETSAYMTAWLIKYKSDEYDMQIVFANTGREREETLEFVRDCEKLFERPVVWVEAKPRMLYQGVVYFVSYWMDRIKVIDWKGGKLGTKHKIVTFGTASRKGEPFREVIARYGIPNSTHLHCTRELKLRPITSYVRSLGWNKGDYYTAIGIRADEFDRINKDHVKEKLYYPLIVDNPMTKPKINFFWKMSDFRLRLKAHQGNCVDCFKKSEDGLLRTAQETPEAFDFTIEMEDTYGDWIPPDRKEALIKSGKVIPKLIRFFRGNISARDILEKAKTYKPKKKVEAAESCDVFSHCKN